MKISVVILNYNGRELLRKFLPSVLQHSNGAEVVVADNNSSDGSQELVALEFPSIRWIQISTNLGFCGGYNYALRQVESDIYVLLNSDVEVTEGWLAPAEVMSDPLVGAAQPRILSYQDRGSFEYAGAGGGFIDSLGYPFCRGRIFETIEKDNGQYSDSRRVFWATGACMFVRADLYHKFGGLDEDFFAHMEEIDLCWKMNRMGYDVRYVGAARVYHVGGGTLSRSNPRKTYFNFRNGLSLVYKHQGGGELIWKFPLRVAMDWLAILNFLFRGSWGDGVAIMKAHIHFLGRFGKEMRKRRELAAVIGDRVKKEDQIYGGSIVFAYYLRGRKYFQDLHWQDKS